MSAKISILLCDAVLGDIAQGESLKLMRTSFLAIMSAPSKNRSCCIC